MFEGGLLQRGIQRLRELALRMEVLTDELVVEDLVDSACQASAPAPPSLVQICLISYTGIIHTSACDPIASTEIDGVVEPTIRKPLTRVSIR